MATLRVRIDSGAARSGAAEVNEAIQRMRSAAQSMAAQMSGLRGQAISTFDTMKAKAREAASSGMDYLNSKFESMKSSVLSLQGALASLGFGLIIKGSIESALALERMEGALRVATGSQEGMRIEMDYLREVSERLGLDLREVGTQYARLAAASKGTALEGQGVRDIFEAVSVASTTLKLTTQDSGLVLLAVQQMMSKGVVSAEELRGQMGERLPGAFQMAARAMGVTTAELGEMLKKGEVTASELLPKLAAEMMRTFGPEVQNSVESTQAHINRFNTALFDFGNRLAEGGIKSAFNSILDGATWMLNNIDLLMVKLVSHFEIGWERIKYSGQVAWEVLKVGWTGFANIVKQGVALLMEPFIAFFEFIKEKMRELGEAMVRIGGDKAKVMGQMLIDASNNFTGVEKMRSFSDSLKDAGGETQALSQKLAALDMESQKRIDSIRSNVEGMFADRQFGPGVQAPTGIGTPDKPDTSKADEEARKKAEAAAKAEESLRKSLATGIEQLDVMMENQLGRELAAYEKRREMVEQAVEHKVITEERGQELLNEMDAQREEKMVMMFGTALEREQLQYDLRMEMLNEAYENELISLETKNARIEEMETGHQENLMRLWAQGVNARQAFTQMTTTNQVKTVLGGMVSMTAGVAQHSRAMFELNKAASLAMAIVALPGHVSKTMGMYPYPLSIAMGALAFAASMAQIQAIRSSSFAGGGGGTTPSLAGSTPTVNGQPVPQGSSPSPQQDPNGKRGGTLVITGIPDRGTLRMEEVRDLMQQVVESQRDGVQVVFGGGG